MSAAQEPDRSDGTFGAWYSIVVLIVATLFSIADRYIFSLLAEPIRRSMMLSDLQIGLLQGFGLALFAAVVSYPIGWLADRYDRRMILAGCIVVWSAGVVACGLARTFPALFVASAVVGGGEAGLIPIIFGLIPEIFFNRMRVVANAVFAGATKLGASAGVAFCGWIVFAVDRYRDQLPEGLRAIESWRLSFFGAATPALLLIPLILTIRIPRKVRPLPSATTKPAMRLLPYLAAERRTLVPFLLALGLMTFGSAASIAWVPMIVMRIFHATPTSAGTGLALSNLAGGIAGFVISIYVLRRLLPRFGPLLPLRTTACTAMLTAASSGLLLFARDETSVYLIQAIQVACSMAGFLVYPTLIQDVAPAALRSRLASLGYLSSIVLASASPVVVGALSDRLRDLPNGLLVASVVATGVSLVGAAALLLRAERQWLRTLQAARSAS